ncbi:MAG: PAAR domain-containing protein [Sedimentitalea sp.]
MGFPLSRITDTHLCLLPVPPTPAVPVPPPAPIPIIPPGATQVLVGKIPAARITDLTAATPPHPIMKGSMTVIIQKIPAARIMDTCACGGMITKGEVPILTGG